MFRIRQDTQKLAKCSNLPILQKNETDSKSKTTYQLKLTVHKNIYKSANKQFYQPPEQARVL